jgi:hypothetical protein
MCNVSASPEREEEMELRDAKRYVEEALRLGDIQGLCLQGGEPLLREDEVCEIAQWASSHGLQTRVSTNAFWGLPEEEASDLIARLKQAGVVHLWISTDAFHAEFVPVATVKHALRAAMQGGMPFYVQSTYLFPESDLFGAQGTYDGPLHNDYDRQTKAIQDELSAAYSPGSFGWGRVIFKERGVALQASLGDNLVRAKQLLSKALDSIPNYGKVDDRLIICVFPDGSTDVNTKRIEGSAEETVDVLVREWCSQEGIPL